jgi:hypothetical protein
MNNFTQEISGGEKVEELDQLDDKNKQKQMQHTKK